MGMLFSAYMMYRAIPNDIDYYSMVDWWNKKNDENISSVVISTHKKIMYSGSKEIRRNTFSPRFKGVNYYLIHRKKEHLTNLVEIVRHEYDSYSESDINYILLPHNQVKFCICDIRDIWIEAIIRDDTASVDDTAVMKSTSISSKPTDQTYIYKLTKPGKGNTRIIEKFIDECIKEYTQSMLDDKGQKIFELVKSQKDENDNIKMIYSKTDFQSNKYLDRNLFYPEVKELTEYIDRFPKKDDPLTYKNKHELEYERMGVTYKCVLMLHGKPGTGKSGTIKGILNRTGRHGILVRWTKIKSCAEFISLFSNIVIKDLTYSLREVCFIFEDFDANASQVLKTRKPEDDDAEFKKSAENLAELAECAGLGDYDLANDFDTIMSTVGEGNSATNALVKRYKKNLKKMSSVVGGMMGPSMSLTSPNDDVLSLECILNTMDGVKELKDAMVIFTTNHLDDIDPAFMRPGRIDKIIQLTLATVDTIKQMICHRFEMEQGRLMELYGEYFKDMKSEVLSPADVQSMIFQYNKGAEKECILRLIEMMR